MDHTSVNAISAELEIRSVLKSATVFLNKESMEEQGRKLVWDEALIQILHLNTTMSPCPDLFPSFLTGSSFDNSLKWTPGSSQKPPGFGASGFAAQAHLYHQKEGRCPFPGEACEQSFAKLPQLKSNHI